MGTLNSYATPGLLLSKRFLDQLCRNDFFAKRIRTCLFRFYRANNFCKVFAVGLLQTCNYFLCHGYLISLCNVYFLRTGLYFFSSMRSVVFLRFFVVM